MTKAEKVRMALDMTPTQAGQVLFGYKPKQSYDTWSQWENGSKKPSAPTDSLFDVILILKQAQGLGVPGVENALEHVLEKLKSACNTN